MVLALTVEGPVGIPVISQADGTEIEDRVSAILGPAHASLFHAVLDEVPTGTLDHTGANRPAPLQVLVLVHVRSVAAIVANRCGDGGALRSRPGRLVSQSCQGGDALIGLPTQQGEQVTTDPGGALGMTLAEHGIGGIPEVLHGVDDVQHQRVVWQGSAHLLLEGFGAIGERHPVADLGTLAPLGACGQPGDRDGLAIKGCPQLFVDRAWARAWGRSIRIAQQRPPPPPRGSADTAGWCRAP
jgi:hypothetical protein